MFKSIEIAKQCTTSSGDFSSGEESESSFVTAFEEFPNDDLCLGYKKKGLASDVPAKKSFEEFQRCEGTCNTASVNTQTSNCAFCRLTFSENTKTNGEKVSTEESISPGTSSTPSLITSSASDGNILLDVTEFELESKFSGCDEFYLVHPTSIDINKSSEPTSNGFQILDSEQNMSDPLSHSSDISTKFPVSMANKSINSVARIIVADSMDRGVEVHRSVVKPPREPPPELVKHAIWTVENLHEMWSQGYFSNVTIATSTGKEFSAHSLVLSLHSGYFSNIFTKSSTTNSNLDGNWRITLADSIIDKTFANVLRFMYTSLILINYDTICDLLRVSVELSLHRLTRLCMDFVDNITVENCLMLLDTVEKVGLTDHIAKTRNFIRENFLVVSTTESFLTLPFDRVATILAEDDLNVESEVDVFVAAKKWIQRNPSVDVRSAPKVMRMVRFELFSPEELAKHVESVEWLSQIPEIRLQVLEAYRYFSLAASCEKNLRPPSPRQRGSRSPTGTGANTQADMTVGRYNFGTCDVSTSMSDKLLFSSSEHASLQSYRQPRPAATEYHDHSRHSTLQQNESGSILLANSAQESQNQLKDASETVNIPETKVNTVNSKLGSRIKPKITTKNCLHPEESQFPRSPKSAKNSTSKKHQNTQGLSDAHFKDINSFNSLSGSSRSTHASTKTSKTSTNKSTNGRLNKRNSDYRLTADNPRSLINGPKPWPSAANLVPSSPEEETSDYIVVSGGVSNEGDVDHPGTLLEIFDPDRTQWRDSIVAPMARNHHAVQFLQDSIYVIGGSDPHGQGDEFIKPVNTVYRYDLRLGKWTQTASMQSARIFHQVGTLFGQLFVVGGQDHKGRTLDSVETYTPVSDSWRPVAPISTPRYAVAMATYGQRLWVAGGYCEQAGSEMVDTVEYFNPYVEEWTSVRSLRYPRCHANLLVNRGHLYIVGGYMITKNEVEKHSTIDVYDEESMMWCYVADMERGQHDRKTVACHDKIFILGARSDDDEERPLTRVDYFDTAEAVWKIEATHLTGSPRFGHACCIIPARSATNWL